MSPRPAAASCPPLRAAQHHPRQLGASGHLRVLVILAVGLAMLASTAGVAAADAHTGVSITLDITRSGTATVAVFADSDPLPHTPIDIQIEYRDAGSDIIATDSSSVTVGADGLVWLNLFNHASWADADQILLSVQAYEAEDRLEVTATASGLFGYGPIADATHTGDEVSVTLDITRSGTATVAVFADSDPLPHTPIDIQIEYRDAGSDIIATDSSSVTVGADGLVWLNLFNHASWADADQILLSVQAYEAEDRLEVTATASGLFGYGRIGDGPEPEPAPEPNCWLVVSNAEHVLLELDSASGTVLCASLSVFQHDDYPSSIQVTVLYPDGSYPTTFPWWSREVVGISAPHPDRLDDLAWIDLAQRYVDDLESGAAEPTEYGLELDLVFYNDIVSSVVAFGEAGLLPPLGYTAASDNTGGTDNADGSGDESITVDDDGSGDLSGDDGSGNGSGGASATTAAGARGDAAELPRTGTAVAWLTLLGMLLLAAGRGLVHHASRRNHASR